jgi:hypothetical protein
LIGGKPLSSPSTNVEITDPALCHPLLAPNVLVRGLVLEYKAEAARRWREAGGGKAGEG